MVYLLLLAGIISTLALWFGIVRNERRRQWAFMEAVSHLRQRRRLAKHRLLELCGKGETITVGARVDLEMFESGTGPVNVLLVGPEGNSSSHAPLLTLGLPLLTVVSLHSIRRNQHTVGFSA